MTLIQHIPRPERRALLVSLGVGVLLLAIKFTAYFITGSAAIFSDAMESIVNVAASAVAAWSLAVAHTPADPEHPYGHGKVEFMSAGFEGGMILLAAIVITVKTVDTLLFHTIDIHGLGVGMVLMATAMLTNGLVGSYLIRTGRRQRSLALEADGYHLVSDAITSVAALAALAVVKIFNWPYADPIAALLIAAYIAYMGLGLLRRSAAGLMDKQDVEDERMLQRILDAHIGPAGREPRICSYHKLRHRHSGRYHWVDFHITVPARLNVSEGHTIASAIEYEIEQALPPGNATAHIEPCTQESCPHCASSPAPP